MTANAQPLEILEDLLKRAKAKGAEAADCLIVRDISLNVAQRLGKREKLERSEAQDLGLRVFIGKRQAIVSTSDLEPKTLDELAERAVAMARAVPEDPVSAAWPTRAAGEDAGPRSISSDKKEPSEADAHRLIARAAEDAARAVPGVTNSEGAEAGWGRGADRARRQQRLPRRLCRRSRWGISVSVLAGEGTGMERDYDFSSAVLGDDLDDPDDVGRRAGERTVRRLNPRKAATAKVPIVYDPRVASGLLGHLAGAINGAAIARGTSFLKDKHGPADLRARASASSTTRTGRAACAPSRSTAKASPTSKRAMIEDGVLTTWLLDLRSARQLGLKSTGHAVARHLVAALALRHQSLPGAGQGDAEELIGDIRQGLYVTELIGMGVNGVTGDYSRGAAGFWIENGELAYPVQRGDDRRQPEGHVPEPDPGQRPAFRYGTDAPTMRIDGMTLAGAQAGA